MEEIEAVYRERLLARNQALERFTVRDRRVADLRLIVFVVFVILGFLIYRGSGISVWWLAVPCLGFAGLVLVHEPIRRAADRSRRSVQFYSNGVARLLRKLAGHRLGRAFVFARGSPVRSRSRHLRIRIGFRAVMYSPDSLGRRHAGSLAARSGEPLNPLRIGTRQFASFALSSTCVKSSSCRARRSVSPSTPRHFRHGGPPRGYFRDEALRSLRPF